MDRATRTDIFGVMVLVGEPVSGPELVRLCRPLGVSATNVKTHLTRLTAEGAVIRTGLRRSHRYAISPQRRKIVHAISQRLERVPGEPWNGAWMMVALRADGSPAERARLRSSLWFEGFRPCGPDTYLRPAWPSAWALARARDLSSAASACVMGPLVGTLHLGQVRRLYRLTVLDARARRLAHRVEAIADRIDDPERAFEARLTIGGDVVEFVSHVPNLPSEIWDDLTGLRELRSAYARFESRVIVRADLFVRDILSKRARPEPLALAHRQRRAVNRQMTPRGRRARRRA